jgi:hypothetical protein
VGVGDLLALAQDELVRLAGVGRTVAPAGRPASSWTGEVRLAA